MIDELKPCPFCASTDVKEYMDKSIHCRQCGAESGVDWNTRPLEDAKDAEIARLTAEIEQLSNREISLLSHLKNNGKLLKAGGEFDEYNFDRYLTPVNAAYVDGLIFQHNEKYK